MSEHGIRPEGRIGAWVQLFLLAGVLALLIPVPGASGAVDEPDGAGVPVLAAAQQRPGTLDPSFGGGGNGFGGDGWTSVGFLGGAFDHALASVDAVALQPDGKIVAVGPASSYSTVLSSALARFNPDGSLDTGFGSGGYATAQSGGVDVIHRVIALQPDGGIVAGGKLGGHFALVRYGLDGSLDAGFGAGGVATRADAGGATALFLQPDGGIVAAATTTAGFFALLRYNQDGTLDTGYGSGGIVTTDFAGPGSGVAIQPDGKFLVVGSIQRATVDFLLARYNPDGRADRSFGGDGKIVTNINGDDSAYAVLLRPDGRIVVAGGFFKAHRGKPESGVALVQYTSAGKLDGSFGSGGKTLTDFYPNNTVRKNPDISFSSAASSLALQPDGRILAAGYLGIAIEFSGTGFLVARYF